MLRPRVCAMPTATGLVSRARSGGRALSSAIRKGGSSAMRARSSAFARSCCRRHGPTSGSRRIPAPICKRPDATPQDASRYRYHALWTAERGSNKYHRLLAFADALPLIRRRTRRDLLGPACSRPRVLATVVELLERTHIRIGNEEYARTNRSHGLTTLRDRHVSIRGRHLQFDFRGKSGVHQTIELDNPHLAKAVKQCQELPGQTLFQYRDDRRKVRDVSSADVNRYLQEISGGLFTAKDFRTWAGTLAAAEALDGAQPVKSASARARAIVKAVDGVAARLGNTRAVCRKCYIHPAVLDAYHAGTTLGRVSPSRAHARQGLREAEARLVALLSRPSKKKAA